MSRKKIIFTIVLFISLLLIVFNDIKNSNEQSAKQQQTIKLTAVSPTLPPSVPQTVFQLFPNPALPDSEGNIDLDLSMNTYNNRTTGVQFTLQYDPTALQFLSISPDDAFYNAKVVTKNINDSRGIITYAMELPPHAKYPSARGHYGIVDMEFTPRYQGTTVVKILSGSVTSPDSTHSVLKSTANTIVKLNQ